jgi:hypothetical protein
MDCPTTFSKSGKALSRLGRHGDIWYCPVCGSVFDLNKKFISGDREKAFKYGFIKEQSLHPSISLRTTVCPRGHLTGYLYDAGNLAYCDHRDCGGVFFEVKRNDGW